MQLFLQLCQPPSDIRPRRQTRGEPTRQVRHAVRSAHTEDLGEFRVPDRRMPPCQVRQCGSRLMGDERTRTAPARAHRLGPV